MKARVMMGNGVVGSEKTVWKAGVILFVEKLNTRTKYLFEAKYRCKELSHLRK